MTKAESGISHLRSESRVRAAAVGAVSVRVGALETTTTALWTDITALHDRLGAAMESIDGINGKVGALETTTTALWTDINALHDRLGAAMESIDGVNGRVGALETTTTALWTDTNALHDRLSAAVESIDGVNGRVGVLEDRLPAVSGRVGVLESFIGAIEQGVSDLGRRLGLVEKAVTSNSANLQTLDGRVSALENAGSIGGPSVEFLMGTPIAFAQSSGISPESNAHIGLTENSERTTLFTVHVDDAKYSIPAPHVYGMLHTPNGEFWYEGAGESYWQLTYADLPAPGTTLEYDLYSEYLGQTAHWHGSFEMPTVAVNDR